MHGMIFGELKKFVDTNLGGDSWVTLLDKAGFAKRVYIPVKEYPDKEIVRLVVTASKITGIQIPDLLKSFGIFMVPDLLLLFRRQIQPDWNLMDLYAQIEDTIHNVVRLKNPGAKPPQLRVHRKSPNEVIIYYSSSRKMCALGIGLIQGIADSFGDLVVINETTCMHHGDACCTISVKLETPIEQARLFSTLKIKGENQQGTNTIVKKVIGTTDNPPVVIVGAGPIGIHAARELLRRAPKTRLILYGAEPWQPYNRVRLSDLLAGEIEWDELSNEINIPENSDVFVKINTPIIQIDKKNKCVIDVNGNQQPYSQLVLAVGSRARRADAKAKTSLYGIYTYRDVDDAQDLMTHVVQSSHTVIVGGGVLGVEVAFALKTQNSKTDVTIIHKNDHLINRQLDSVAADFLLKQVQQAGIKVILNSGIDEFIGESDIKSLRLIDGDLILCDNLISCAGIVANTSLAVDAGLNTDSGIQVNDYLQTSNPYIYAIGECAEHQGKTYGLVGPGIEQATIAVNNILHKNIEKYKGSDRSMRVKLKHLPVFSLAKYDLSKQGLKQLIFKDTKAIKFREIFMSKGRLVGATAIGEWPEIGQVQAAIDNEIKIWPWHRFYFARTGSLWPEAGFSDPNEWPDKIMLCTCGAVTRGEIGLALKEGCDTVKKISERTGAALGCGTCKPLLAMLTGSDAEPLAPPLKGFLFFCMLLTFIFSAGFLLPSITVAPTALEPSFIYPLLFDNGWQQVTGYIVMALMIFSFVLTANKRWKWFQFASFYFWRATHVALLVFSIAVLLIHTNFNWGINSNFQFISFYFLTMSTGLILGVLAIIEGGFFGAMFRGYRAILTRLHIVGVWVMTGLLIGHITSVYYF
jgi:nitrite reductase (NADH) large subunit